MVSGDLVLCVGWGSIVGLLCFGRRLSYVGCRVGIGANFICCGLRGSDMDGVSGDTSPYVLFLLSKRISVSDNRCRGMRVRGSGVILVPRRMSGGVRIACSTGYLLLF